MLDSYTIVSESAIFLSFNKTCKDQRYSVYALVNLRSRREVNSVANIGFYVAFEGLGRKRCNLGKKSYTTQVRSGASGTQIVFCG